MDKVKYKSQKSTFFHLHVTMLFEIFPLEVNNLKTAPICMPLSMFKLVHYDLNVS